MDSDAKFTLAVRNLLSNAAGLAPGARVLVVHEPASAGYFGADLPGAFVGAARGLGHAVDALEKPFDPHRTRPDPQTQKAMDAADLTVFFARLGDQTRFRPAKAPHRIAISYALDRAAFASQYGRLDYRVMAAMRDMIDRALRGARDIRITCPAGTDIHTHVPEGDITRDTHALRFPLSVHTPMPGACLSGRIAQRGFLVGTGSQFYQPYAMEITGVLFVEIEAGRITGFAGPSATAARAHYSDIGARFAIDPWAVHSWHGGIHPACAFHDPAATDFARWSGGAFGNPRLLHFHSCGDYAPGEICLNLLDPTVETDGIAIRRHGRLTIAALPGAAALLARSPDLAAALDAPARACGEAPGGGLSFH